MRKRLWRRRFVGLILLAGLILGIYLAWRIWTRRRYEKAGGIYITTGGESFLEIEPRFLGKLKAREGNFVLSLYGSDRLYSRSVSCQFFRNRLYITQTEKYHPPIFRTFWWMPLNMKYICNLVLEPSKKNPGDWDLTDAQIIVREGGLRMFTYSHFWEFLKDSKSPKDFFERLGKGLRSREILCFSLDTPQKPIPGFLHRIDDPRIPEYFSRRLRGEDSEAIYEMIKEIAADHETDPYLKLHLIEQEAAYGDANKAQEMWNEWEKKNSPITDAYLEEFSQRAWQHVSGACLKKNHPEIKHYSDVFKPHLLDMRERKEWLLKFFKTDQLMFTPDPLVPPVLSSSYKGRGVANFLEMQVSAKTLRIMAILSLFRGEREESLKVLCGVYRIGQCLCSNHTLIDKLIGVAIRAIAAQGMQIYILNTCETGDDFEKAWHLLERVYNTPGQRTNYTDIIKGEYSLLCFPMNVSGRDMPNYLEAQTRSGVSDMKFELVRMALTAKYKLIRDNKFPGSEEEFKPFFQKGVPKDIFTEKDRLRFISHSRDEFYVYSVGPDKKDNKVAISYDPTNGTITPGDIFIRIPREREFPFPREGVRAKNAYELLDQFPNGLPADSFADTKGRPFSIVESTETSPVLVFSFGPDTDEADFKPFTKGITKGEGGIFEPVPTPPPPKDATYGRSLQWVMKSSHTPPKIPQAYIDQDRNGKLTKGDIPLRSSIDKKHPPPGYYTIEPMYDPTNGTVTEGDIFIEILKPGTRE